MPKTRIEFNGNSNEIDDIFIDDKSILYMKPQPVYAEQGLYQIDCYYETSSDSYIICNFKLKCIKDNPEGKFLTGIALRENPVFSSRYEIKNTDEKDKRSYHRATSVNFSVDDRRITNSVDFLFETVMDGRKIIRKDEEGRFLGWEVQSDNLKTMGGEYEGRWMINVSSIDNEPNKVRGQRIYHWYGHYPELPSLDMIGEMHEYGCSILILHMPSFKWIDGSVPIDETKFKKVIERAQSYGMKMMFYMQPLLISQASPMHATLSGCINDNGKLCWHSLKNTQIVFYEPNSDYDCDELCLRCPEAYSYIKNSVLGCYKKYGFDGLYIDFAWPSIAICTDERHGHAKGIFNFYDYLRLMRELRQEIGKEAIMIGHGGSLLVPSDYAEGFDACLTGEGQKDLFPETIGVQTGVAPTLWTMHRRKERQFRSRDAMAGIIREGLTPHIGLGILGKSIMASMDPAHTPHYIALWQMWKAFPMEKARYYNYLSEKVIELDMDEVTYSLYVVDGSMALLILCSGGGPESEKAVSVEVNVKLDVEKLGLPKKMKSMILKGNTYDTFRMYEWKNINDGEFRIPEIAINEFLGILLYEGNVPVETMKLKEHLEGRFERMVFINSSKMERLLEADLLIDGFNELDLTKLDADEFMKDRTME